MSKGRWSTRKAAKENRWHSRRHETSEAQTAARERYQAKAQAVAKKLRRTKPRAA